MPLAPLVQGNYSSNPLVKIMEAIFVNIRYAGE
jgi:hypothetical protein